jgi:hypothetical protein
MKQGLLPLTIYEFQDIENHIERQKSPMEDHGRELGIAGVNREILNRERQKRGLHPLTEGDFQEIHNRPDARAIVRSYMDPSSNDPQIPSEADLTFTPPIPKRLDNKDGLVRDNSVIKDSFRDRLTSDLAPEKVNHPSHYGGADNPYEAIKVIEAWDLGFCLGNVLKYLLRSSKKGAAMEDLKKAAWYLNREIERMSHE